MKDEITIRHAEEKDIESILELLHEIFLLHKKIRPDLVTIGKSKFGAQEIKQKISSENSPIYVACDFADHVIGYLFVEFIQYYDVKQFKTAWIEDLCVNPEYRGLKIGQKLMDYVSQEAKSKGCFNLELHVWEGNDSAIKFYENYGMKMQKRLLEKKL